MKPPEFIDFAQQLAVQAVSTPALLRTVTSRAYYGAFHLAKEFIRSLGLPVTAKHDTHIWLMGSQQQSAHEAGKLLADLNNARINADYKLEEATPELPAFARKSVERARAVQSLLLACEGVVASQITARRTSAGR